MKTTHQQPKPAAGVLRRLKKQGGQAIVLLALTGTLLIGGVGIAVDLAVGYMYSIAAERAAAAAALSGVVFMPDQFSSASAVPSAPATVPPAPPGARPNRKPSIPPVTPI